MKISRSTSICGFLVLILLLNSCSGNGSANSNAVSPNVSSEINSNAEIVPQDNVEELAKIIKLNFTPEEATYSEINQNIKNSDINSPAPNEKRIVAVLRFSAENAGQVAAQAEKYKPAAPADVDAESWFPAELIAQSQLTGDGSLKGLTYAADDFLQPPYSKGKLTRIGSSGYFILELISL
ncbi:MAG: hypothetical protein LH614_12200 [Pyrinomonadaceae bacterium]|nr:hypothetical protein [Pyrinomonadaceae bacterium]